MNELTILAKLLLAALFAGSIGFLREVEGKTAGLRTHILVSLGSCLIMLISIYMFELYKTGDPGRIAANVVVGIGFLGAGTILREPGAVRGLTTAASIWIAAAIGLAVGCGFYWAAFFTTAIALIVIQLLHELEIKYLRPSEREKKD